jgi:hypothetical protein
MKKTKEKERQLLLNRETIQILNDPALLELARGQAQHMGVTTMGSSGTAVTGC